MKQTVLISLFIIIFSCEDKEDCFPEFKGSLKYLKAYIKPDNKKTYYIYKIENHIGILESTSGILNGHKGNIIGRYIVLQSDIDNWEKWLIEKCPTPIGSDK